MTKLPNKPSELIRVALEDLRSVEKLKTVHVNMETWLEYNCEDNTCCACLAGAVMYRRFDGKRRVLESPYGSMSPGEFEYRNTDKFMALEYFRNGDVEGALNRLGFDLPPYLLSDIEVVDYHDDPKLFKKQMAKLADVLEACGQ